ncbi:hypothetical protein FJZ18_02865 [Candidatus Pacearchaeota archaeon]|nr:hypothetical protein [Candidatus Pacearchaeota archaeon]
MDEVKSIKGIDDETWRKFKALAAAKRVTMGVLLTTMIKEYEKYANDVWDKILHGEKILSDEEAEEMHTVSRKLRKENWVRNASRS